MTASGRGLRAGVAPPARASRLMVPPHGLYFLAHPQDFLAHPQASGHAGDPESPALTAPPSLPAVRAGTLGGQPRAGSATL
jgi:hypothetical protein